MLRLEKINKYLLFAPFLLLYLLIIFFFNGSLKGDEERYLFFANNLCKGFYSPPPPYIYLDNGPGYPLLLALGLKLHLPILVMRLFNAAFLYLSIIFIFKTCNLYLDFKKSLIFALIFGVYYPFYQFLVILYSELISIFLITGFIYFVHKRTENRPIFQSLILPAIFLGYLALTKVIFGYIITVSIIGLFIFYLIYRYAEIKRLLYIALLSLALCVPYLVYTYSLTHQILYWGGNKDTLYWMSSPHKEELGDWHPEDLRENEALIKNHMQFIDSIQNFPYMLKNEAYTKKSIQNIKEHPERYIMNVFANAGRMFFNYPFSYNRHGNIWFVDVAYMLVNMFFVVALFIILLLFLFYFKRTGIKTGYLLLFILVYFGASLLVSAEKRMFFPLVPIIMTTAAFYLSQFKIERIN
jgi:hypothetical protein